MGPNVNLLMGLSGPFPPGKKADPPPPPTQRGAVTRRRRATDLSCGSILLDQTKLVMPQLFRRKGGLSGPVFIFWAQ